MKDGLRRRGVHGSITKMHIPATFSALIDGRVRIEPVLDECLIYPPVGFLPWPIGSLGNGDDYGYYWPIGKESSDPIVAMMSHDCWALIPVASSIEALAQSGDCREVTALVNGVEEDSEHEDFDGEYETIDIAEKLTIDPNSAHLLVANADLALANSDLSRSESLYLRAIEILPEYTAAHFGLAMLYRRQRNLDGAVRWMLEAVRSPLAFQGASFWAETSLQLNRSDFRNKCLTWLKQARVENVPTSAMDPFFQVRDRLTFATGVKTIDDFTLYDQVIDEYVACGKPLEAIRLLMLFGELMHCETISFRERSGFSYATYRDRLLRLFRAFAPQRARFLE